MDPGHFADWDGDGLPDHVLGPDGIWRAFDPSTGEVAASPLSADLGGGNPYNTPSLDSIEVGTQGSPNYPPLPSPPPDFGGPPTPAPHPSFQTGQLHPSWGGEPLTPGGTYRGPDGAQQQSYQEQVSVPGGAAAGPFETRGAYPPSRHSYGGDSTAGGGSDMGANSPIGQKLRGKVWGMANKITGAGSSSSYTNYPNYKTPNYPKPVVYKPGDPKMRGPFAKGIKAKQAAGLYDTPQIMAERVARPGQLPVASTFSDDILNLPMSEYALLMGGNNIRAPKRDLYGNLTDKDKSLSQYTNALGELYSNVINRETLPNVEQMISNLTNAQRNSSLGALFRGEKPAKQEGAPEITKRIKRNARGVPVGDQTDEYLNLTDAIFNRMYYGTDDPYYRAAQSVARDKALKFAAANLSTNPRKTPSMAKSITGDLFASL